MPVDGTGAAFAAPGDSASGAPRPRLALDVGTYLDEDLARSARDRLTADSGLQGWIVPTQDAGGTSYRVILGVFRSEDRATISANSLLERGLISEARVVPMPSRRSRY